MRKAFSLMELLIVILILGLLAGLVLPNLIGKGEEAKRKIVCIQMKNIAEALKMFKVDNGRYPTTEEGINALIKNPDPQKYKNYTKGGYVDTQKSLKDAWNHPFIYTFNDDDDDKFEIISLGSDGKEGGSGEKADIYYSKCIRK